MLNLWHMFYEYIQISYQRIPGVFLLASIIYVLFGILSKTGSKKDIVFRAVLSMACSFVFVMTLFSRTTAEYDVTLRPFWSYVEAYKTYDTELCLQIVMNIAMYVPIGFLLPGCFRIFKKFKNTVLTVLVCSVGIELLQYLFSIGYSDIDDILNNVLGTVIGYSLYVLCIICTEKSAREKKSER